MTGIGTASVRWGTARGHWVIGATVGATSLMMLDATTVSVALPAIADDLSASVSGLQWILNAFTVSLIALILLSGRLADRFGRRRLFEIGCLGFAGASALCAVAPSLHLLIAARAIEGIGAAILTPVSLAVIQVSFEPKSRARAVGAWSGLTGIASALGPILGGWLVAEYGWRSIFWLNVPIAVIVMWIAARHLPEDRSASTNGSAGFDVRSTLLASIGLAGLSWALITSGSSGLTANVLMTGMAGAGLLGAFIWLDRGAVSPLVPPRLFRSRQFTGVNLVTLLAYGGLPGVFFLLVIRLQDVYGYSPLLAGAALLPITLLMLMLSTWAGAILDAIGPRLLMTAGPLIMSGAMWLLASLPSDASYSRDILAPALLFGLGLAATVTPLTATLLASVPIRAAAVASAINNAVARTASLLAVAGIPPVAGLTLSSYDAPASSRSGFELAMKICAGLLLAAAILAWLMIRDRLPDGRRVCDSSRLIKRLFCAIGAPPMEPDLASSEEGRR